MFSCIYHYMYLETSQRVNIQSVNSKVVNDYAVISKKNNIVNIFLKPEYPFKLVFTSKVYSWGLGWIGAGFVMQ